MQLSFWLLFLFPCYKPESKWSVPLYIDTSFEDSEILKEKKLKGSYMLIEHNIIEISELSLKTLAGVISTGFLREIHDHKFYFLVGIKHKHGKTDLCKLFTGYWLSNE